MNALLILFFTSIATLSSLSAWGAPPLTNPMIRACNLTNGLVHIIKLAAPVNDEILFCQYGELSLVDAPTVVSRLVGEMSLSLLAYQKNVSGNMNACSDSKGRIIKGLNNEGNAYLLCLFSDKSAMELSTLAKGITSPDNSSLNQGLSL